MDLVVSELTYTFSTIAQALAGAIALLGAFALYRLQAIDQGLFDLGRHMIDSFSDRPDMVDEFYQGRYSSLLEKIASHERTQTWQANQPHNWTRLQQFRRLSDQRARLVPSLKRSIWLSLLTMVASVLALSLVGRIAPVSCAVTACLVAGVTLFVACLFWYYRLIKSMLE